VYFRRAGEVMPGVCLPFGWEHDHPACGQMWRAPIQA
jgi:hypothetical protein